MKRIAIVTSHFPPSNLAGVHRARLWAQHLPEFGWEPTIVTIRPDYYEENLDPKLLELVSPELRVIRTKAISTWPVRIVGDVGVRAFYWQRKALEKLIDAQETDFIHITIPSNYSALLGKVAHQRSIPYGIDYQDPWVVGPSSGERILTKAWLSRKLAGLLEPKAVRYASLITGVAPLYYEAVLERNPHLHDQCITAAMPVGGSKADFDFLQSAGRETFLFPKGDGLFHMVYAGAMLPQAYTLLERLLEALALLRERGSDVMKRLRIHFVGTGKSPNDPSGYNIRPYVERFGLENWVTEHPDRISYLDVLNHLIHASSLLILGSTEGHYTPSKVYQVVQAKRPIFAMLHEQSTAVEVLRVSRAGHPVTFKDQSLPAAEEIASQLVNFIRNPQYTAEQVKWAAFEEYSARNSASALVDAIDRAQELFAKRGAAK